MTAPDNSHRAAIGLVAVATLALSFKGIFAKLAFAAGLGPMALLAWRYALALPLFWLAARALLRAPVFQMTRAQGKAACIGGALMACATGLDFYALSQLDVGLSRIVLFTFPAFVLLFQALESRERPKPRQMLAFAVTWTGLIVVLGPAKPESLNAVGLAAALGAAITYALYLRHSTKVIQELGTARYTAISGAAITGLVLLAFPVASTPAALFDATSAGYLWAGCIVVFSTVIPFLMLLEGMRHIGAERGALIALGGPAVTVLAAWVILGETMNPLQLSGLVIVSAGIAILQGVDKVFRPA